jgi:radical SAM protein with 4Fe4S-binding SPASM domain
LNELILWNLIRALNYQRAANLAKTGASFLLSALLNRNFVWGKPSILTIEPTNICNLRCPLCSTGSGEMQREGGKMDMATFQNIIDKMGNDLFFLLLYHQGEPYINKHFLEFVKLAKSKNIYTTTSTNAHYFSDEIIHNTIDSGLDSMIVSLDGVSQDVYQHYRVKGKVDKVINGTKRFMEIKQQRGIKTPLIALQFLVMKHNEHELEAVKKLAKEIGVDRLLIKNIEVMNTQQAREWLPQNEKYRRYDFDGQTLKVKNTSKKSCPRVWLSTLVNWDGSVVPCCFDKNGTFELGNINDENSLTEIWQGQKYKDFRHQLINNRSSIDMCSNCNQGLGSFIFNWNTKDKVKNSAKRNLFPILDP